MKSKPAKFKPDDNPDLPHNQWWTYPSGAHFSSLGGALRVHVAKLPNGVWAGDVWHHAYGMIQPVRAKTRAKAMKAMEEWVLFEAVSLLQALNGTEPDDPPQFGLCRVCREDQPDLCRTCGKCPYNCEKGLCKHPDPR